MSNKADTIEKMAQELKCEAPRVTADLIKSRIVEVEYKTIRIAGQKVMYCGIKMDNGFVSIGAPATCVDEDNWRDEIGREVSYENSFNELWKLEAYRMKSEGVNNV